MPTSDTVVIKKYGNRRLYDTSASKYVNLEDIAVQVRNGKEVKIVDAKSGEDLTRATLAQIIMEEAKSHPAGLPLELLKQLLMASDKVRQDFMSWYLKSAFESYQKVQSAFQSGLSQVFSPLDMVRSLIPRPASEVEDLKKRVAELEVQLAKAKVARGVQKGAKKVRKA